MSAREGFSRASRAYKGASASLTLDEKGAVANENRTEFRDAAGSPHGAAYFANRMGHPEKTKTELKDLTAAIESNTEILHQLLVRLAAVEKVASILDIVFTKQNSDSSTMGALLGKVKLSSMKSAISDDLRKDPSLRLSFDEIGLRDAFLRSALKGGSFLYQLDGPEGVLVEEDNNRVSELARAALGFKGMKSGETLSPRVAKTYQERKELFDRFVRSVE